jgi:hypothetical protein
MLAGILKCPMVNVLNVESPENSKKCNYKHQEGVHIKPHDFGGLSGVAALDPGRPKLTATYANLISFLKRCGYKERVSLWGAPYDWCLAADGLEQEGVADAFQSLIEMVYAIAGYSKVVVIAHSMVGYASLSLVSLSHSLRWLVCLEEIVALALFPTPSQQFWTEQTRQTLTWTPQISVKRASITGARVSKNGGHRELHRRPSCASQWYCSTVPFCRKHWLRDRLFILVA